MSISSKELSLWQLTNEHEYLLSKLYDSETGEVNEIVQAKLNALEPNIEKKCIAVSQWIRKLESEDKQLTELLIEIENRKTAYNREVKRYMDYLQVNMTKQGIKEIKCPFFTIKLKKNPYSTDIIDDSLIPTKFMKTKEIIKVETKADKNAIKDEVLKTGEQVPGAYVFQKERLEILTDKI
jgi:hypothetical protein